MAVVGDDAFDGGEAILHRTELGAQLRVLGAQKLDPLHLLIAVLGLDRLTSSAVEPVAALDAEPGGSHPAHDTDHARECAYRTAIRRWQRLQYPTAFARSSDDRSSGPGCVVAVGKRWWG